MAELEEAAAEDDEGEVALAVCAMGLMGCAIGLDPSGSVCLSNSACSCGSSLSTSGFFSAHLRHSRMMFSRCRVKWLRTRSAAQAGGRRIMSNIAYLIVAGWITLGEREKGREGGERVETAIEK